jgi:hypothetical protein
MEAGSKAAAPHLSSCCSSDRAAWVTARQQQWLISSSLARSASRAALPVRPARQHRRARHSVVWAWRRGEHWRAEGARDRGDMGMWAVAACCLACHAPNSFPAAAHQALLRCPRAPGAAVAAHPWPRRAAGARGWPSCSGRWPAGSSWRAPWGLRLHSSASKGPAARRLVMFEQQLSAANGGAHTGRQLQCMMTPRSPLRT